MWEEKQVNNELFIDLYELKYINIVLIYNVGINDKMYLSMYNSIIYTCDKYLCNFWSVSDGSWKD